MKFSMIFNNIYFKIVVLSVICSKSLLTTCDVQTVLKQKKDKFYLDYKMF